MTICDENEIENMCYTSACALNIDKECIIPSWTNNCPGRTYAATGAGDSR